MVSAHLPSRSATSPGPRVAVVGAGVAGLACATRLASAGIRATVLDKGRAPGGRLTTARTPAFEADIGAPYFTARSELFRQVVAGWREAGVVAAWRGRLAAVAGRGAPFQDVPPLPRYVGVPRMSAVTRHLATNLDVRQGHRVDAILRTGAGLILSGAQAPAGMTLGPASPGTVHPPGTALDAEFGVFDAVVFCLPADQTTPHLRTACPDLAAVTAPVQCEPCVALAFEPATPALTNLPVDGVFLGREGDEARVLTWLARNSSKPGRGPTDAWVLHAAPAWSRTYLRAPEDAVQAMMLAELADLLDLPPIATRTALVQRWAYARVPAGVTVGAQFDAASGVGIAGDWTAGGRVEGAFLSGWDVADQMLQHLVGWRVD